MFDQRQRERLDRLSGRISQWLQRLPPEGLHKELKRLQDEIDRERNRLRWAVIADESVRALSNRYDELEASAASLLDVIDLIKALTPELDLLEKMFANESASSKEYGKKRCAEWRVELAGFSNCTREAQLIAAKTKVQAIERTLRLHAEALHRFQEADRLLRDLRATTDSAVLKKALEEQRNAMTQGKLSQDAIDELSNFAKPLEELYRKTEPPEIKKVSNALTEIDRWNRALELSNPDYATLIDRYRALESEWRLSEPDEPLRLLEEAQTLLNTRIQQAHLECDQKRRDLDNLLHDLQSERGPQADIASILESLKDMRITRVHEYRDWKDRFEQAWELFKTLVSHHDLALEKRLDERCEQCRIGLESLDTAPIASPLRRKTSDLKQRLRLLIEAKSAQDLLLSLREANAMIQELEVLQRQADSEREEFDALRLSLREDHALLQDQAMRTGVDFISLVDAIDSLLQTSSDLDLDRALDAARDTMSKLEESRAKFISSAQDLWRKNLMDLDSRGEVLRAAGFGDASFHGPSRELPNDAQQCVDRLAEQAMLSERLQQKLEVGGKLLQTQLAQQRVELSNLLKQTPNPGYEREEQAARLLSELDTLINSLDALTGIDGFEALSELRRSCDRFWLELRHKEIELRADKERLDRQLRVFYADRLRNYCPEVLFEMAADRVRGIPDPPRPEHARQLEETSLLLEALEQHCRRRIAQQVVRELKAMNQNKNRFPDPNAVRALLDAIDKHDANEPLPYATRAQLTEAVRLVSHG